MSGFLSVPWPYSVRDMIMPAVAGPVRFLADHHSCLDPFLSHHPSNLSGPKIRMRGKHLRTHDDEVRVGPQPVQEDLHSRKEALCHQGLQFLLKAALIATGAAAGLAPL